MSKIRLYYPTALPPTGVLALDGDAFHHAFHVLRCRKGDTLVLFDGSGSEIEASVLSVARRSAQLAIGEKRAPRRESPLDVELFQGISKGERMDWALQKATELGVSRIVPVYTEHCAVRRSASQAQKKWLHWQKVIVSACEQSGRVALPELAEPQDLSQAWRSNGTALSLFLDPAATQTPNSLRQLPQPKQVRLVIGPEGGLADAEIQFLMRSGALGLRLGPRILRTETATASALTLCQSFWGDFND